MRYGTGLDSDKPFERIVDSAKRAAESGFATLSCSHIFGYDAVSLLSSLGLVVDGPELMTAVVPIYTRHPYNMAQVALSAQAVTNGRFVLGIGLSHQILVESVYGRSFERPLQAMTEYLSILVPLLRGEGVSVKGEQFSCSAGPIQVPGATAPPVIVAALGGAMLELAGAEADGTATWMTGVNTLGGHIVPTITRAAERAGRPAPRIMAALPVCVTSDVEGAREAANNAFAIYGQLPSYRAMLDREGASQPGDAAVVGSEDEVVATIKALEDSGVTDFSGAPFGSPDDVRRTMGVLAGLAKG